MTDEDRQNERLAAMMLHFELCLESAKVVFEDQEACGMTYDAMCAWLGNAMLERGFSVAVQYAVVLMSNGRHKVRFTVADRAPITQVAFVHKVSV